MPLLLFCVFLFPLLFVSPPNQLLRSDAMIPPNDLHRFNLVCVFGCVCVHVCVFQRATARVISSLVAMVCVGLREREREREEETSIVRQERSIFRESQTSKYASCVCMRVCAWVYAYTLARTYAAQTGYSNVSPVVGRDLWRA